MTEQLKLKALVACVAVGKLGIEASRIDDATANAINRACYRFAKELHDLSGGEFPHPPETAGQLT